MHQANILLNCSSRALLTVAVDCVEVTGADGVDNSGMTTDRRRILIINTHCVHEIYTRNKIRQHALSRSEFILSTLNRGHIEHRQYQHNILVHMNRIQQLGRL